MSIFRSGKLDEIDVGYINQYIDALNSGTSQTDAFASTMADASPRARAFASNIEYAGNQLEHVQVTARGAGTGLKLLASIGNMVVSTLAALAVQWAITEAVKGFDQLVNGAHNAAVAFKETAEESSKRASDSEKEVNTLDELISKYQELATSGSKDADTRAQIRDIQSQINELVGSEGGNIDLVNGSLSQQLAILQQIRQEKEKDSIQEAYAAYQDAKRASDNVTGDSDGNFLIGKGYHYVGKRNKAVEKALLDAGFTLSDDHMQGSIDYVGWLSNTLVLRSNKDAAGNVISGAEENIKVLNQAIDALEKAGLKSEDIYSVLIQQRESYQKQLQTTNNQLDGLLEQVINSHRNFSEELKGVGGESADAFKEYYSGIVDSVVSDEYIKDLIASGELSAQQVQDSVISALSTSIGLSNGYNDWKKQFDRGTALGNFAKNARGNISDSLARYIDTLEGEDLSIALAISLDPNSVIQTSADLESAIARWKKVPETEKISFTDFAKSDTIKDEIDPLFKKIQDAQAGIKALHDGTSDVNDLLVQHPEWAIYDDLEKGLPQLIDETNKEIEKRFEKIGENIKPEDIPAFERFKQAYYEAISELSGVTVGIDIDVESSGMDTVISAIKSSVSQIGLSNSQIDELEKRYKDLPGYMPDKLFERTANGIHLNTKELQNLESVRDAMKTEEMRTELADLTQQYADLTEQINNTEDAATQRDLYGKRSDVEKQIKALTALQSQYSGVHSLYNKWKQAQSMGEEGDMYDDIAGGLKNIKELYEKGLVGTNKFKSAIELMTGKDASKMSTKELIAAYDEAYPKMKKYFTDTSKGSEQFLKDLESIGAATQKNGQWTFDFDADEVAKKLGVSAELVEIMMRKLKDYNFDVDLSGFGSGLDAYATDIDTGIKKIEAEEEKLAEAYQNQDISIGAYISQWNQLESARKSLETMKGGGIDVDSMSVEEARDKVTELSSVIDTIAQTGLNIPVILSGQYNELRALLGEIWDFGKNGTVDASPQGTEGFVPDRGYWARALTVDSMAKAAQESREAAEAVMTSFFNRGGSVDLLNRPLVPTEELIKKGYDVPEGEIATLLSHSVNIGDNGEIGVVLTPILPDGQSIEQGKMLQALESVYLDSNGKAQLPDGDWGFDLADILVSQIDVSDIPEQQRGKFMDFYSNMLHVAQEAYYDSQEPLEPPEIDTSGMFDQMQKVEDEWVFAPKVEPHFDGAEMSEAMEEAASEPVVVEAEPSLVDDWQSAFDEQLGNVETPEVQIEPSLPENEPKDYSGMITFGEPIKADVEPELQKGAGNQIAGELQSEVDSEPIIIKTRTIADAGTGAYALIDAANKAGVASDAVDALSWAYIHLSDAMDAVNSADTGNMDEAIANLRSAATEFTTAFADLGSQVDLDKIEIDADTSKALATVASLSIPETQVVFNPETSKVDAYVPSDKTASVNYRANFSKVVSSPTPTLNGVIEYTRRIVGGSTGTEQAAGTAHAQGTAYKNGLGSVKHDVTALSGEVGPEAVIRNGKWFLVGENGAEFNKFKSGDIIFNASQTEELLRTGKVRSGGGRGKVFGDGSAYAGGTAFALVEDHTGKTRQVSQSTKITGGGDSSAFKTSSTSSKKKKKKKSSSSSKNSKDESSDSNDAFDWVEVAIERVEQTISNLARTADSTFKTLATRLSASNNQISKIYQEIATQQAGYTRYMQQAESVGLSDDLKARVQSGAIDITQYDDDTKKLIESYKEWYDKAQKCSDAVDELSESVHKLYSERFDAIEKEFDNALSIIEHRINTFNNDVANAEYTGAAEPFGKIIAANANSVDILRNKLAELQAAQRAAVEAGTDVGSEDWYEMEGAINSVKEKLQETETAITKIYVDAFDAIEKRFDGLNGLVSDTMSLLEGAVAASEYTGDDKPFKTMIATRQKSAKALEAKLVSLQDQMDLAVDTGRIKEGSAAWLEMKASINQVTQALQENATEIRKLYKEIFDDIEQRFSNATSLIDGAINYLQTGLDELEAKGYLGGTEFYAEMSKIQTSSIEKQRKELTKLEEALKDALDQGQIKAGSDAWYEMQNKILDVKQGIRESSIELVKYASAMRDIKWDMFDAVLEKIGAINDEAEFMIKLMENSKLYDDRGQATDTGTATIGLHAMEYNVYMKQADKYADEVKRLNEEIAKDPYNNDLITRRDKLLKLQRESILSAEQEKKAIKDLVEDGINAELDSLSKLISKYKDNLDSARDLYEYQKSIEKQTKNIAALQKQLSAYSGDKSEENAARVQKLTVDLSEAMEKLEETQYDRYITDQKKMLDDLYDDFENILNQRLDNIDFLTGEMIDYTNLNASDILATISSETDKVGTVLSNSMSNIWSATESNGRVVSMYGGSIEGKLDNINNTTGEKLENINGSTTNGLTGVQGATNGVQTAVDGVNSSVNSVGEKVDSIFNASGEKLDNIKTSIDTEIGSLATYVSNMYEPVNTLGVDIIDGISSDAESVVNSVDAVVEQIDNSSTEFSGGVANFSQIISSQLGSIDNVLNSVLNYVQLIKDGQANAAVTYQAVQSPVVNTEATVVNTDVPVAVTPAAEETTTESKKKKKKSSKKSSSSSSSSSNSNWLTSVAKTVTTAAKTTAKTVSSVAKKAKKAVGMSTGGFIAELQETAYRNGDDIVTINTLKKGEAVLTPQQAVQFKTFTQNLPQIQNLVDTSGVLRALTPIASGIGQTTIEFGDTHIEIERVQDYNDFVRQLRDDKTYENMMDAMILGKLTGASSLTKKKFY